MGKNLKGYKPKNIIVRMPNWIGDFVMATPILSDLKAAYPSASLTAMCKRPLEKLLQHDPSIDELYVFSKSKKFGRRQDLKNIIGKLRKGRYDLGILLTHSFSSAWYFWQGRVKYRIGYKANLRSWMLTHPQAFSKKVKDQHLVITYKELLSPLGIPVSDTAPRLLVTETEKEHCDQILKTYGIPPNATLVGINPGAAYGSAKCWLPGRFRKIAKKFLEYDPNLHILFFGDQRQSQLIKSLCQGFPARVVNLAGITSLRELMALIKRCDVFLTNDSGPMHIAAAVSTPLVALFGSTSEILTGPYNKGTTIHKHVACSPCFKRICPIDFRCMKSIETNEVFEKLIKILEEKKRHD